MGDFPMMTEFGTFIINGTERVIVTQLVRSPGAYLMEPKDATKQVFTANLMPCRGSWLELEMAEEGHRLCPHRPEAKAADHHPPPGSPREGPDDRIHAGHQLERGPPQALQQLDLHPAHAREGYDRRARRRR